VFCCVHTTARVHAIGLHAKSPRRLVICKKEYPSKATGVSDRIIALDTKDTEVLRSYVATRFVHLEKGSYLDAEPMQDQDETRKGAYLLRQIWLRLPLSDITSSWIWRWISYLCRSILLSAVKLDVRARDDVFAPRAYPFRP